MNHMTKPLTTPYSDGFKAGLALALKTVQDSNPGSDDQQCMVNFLVDDLTARLDVANGLCPHRDTPWGPCSEASVRFCGTGCACLCHENHPVDFPL